MKSDNQYHSENSYPAVQNDKKQINIGSGPY